MSPGIVEADPAIDEGDLVWIRDEKNMKPLAIGRALVKGTDMAGGGKGKAVKSIHYVGDRLWTFED
jgi:PUA domain protein